MDSTQSMQTQPIDPQSNILQSDLKKTSTLPWICAIVCFILAVAGICLSVYYFMDANNKSIEIADLKARLSAISTDETEEGADELVIYSTLKDTNNKTTTQRIKARSFPTSSADEFISMTVNNTNGDLSCEVKKYDTAEAFNGSSDGKKLKDCDLSAHTGKVVDLIGGNMGNGGDNLILILNTEGKIEYLNNSGEDYSVLKKLELTRKVVRVYGDGKVTTTDKEGNGAYYPEFDVIVQYTDGTTESLSSYFNL